MYIFIFMVCNTKLSVHQSVFAKIFLAGFLIESRNFKLGNKNGTCCIGKGIYKLGFSSSSWLCSPSSGFVIMDRRIGLHCLQLTARLAFFLSMS